MIKFILLKIVLKKLLFFGLTEGKKHNFNNNDICNNCGINLKDINKNNNDLDLKKFLIKIGY